MLSTGGTVSVVGSVRDSGELLELLARGASDVLVCDYSMPGGRYGDGLPLFKLIKQRYPAVRIVVLTMLENPGVVHSLLKLGISCILSKSDSMSHLLPAVHVAFADGRYLSPTIAGIVSTLSAGGPELIALTARELEVVRLYVSGLTVNEIAERLSRSKKTISTQKGAAMLKLGIRRDVDLLRYGIESGLVAADPGVTPHRYQ
ncbi:response regulator transcription factor [Stenotrophomonas sp. SY1]|nr:response regulator transcription factor [Stenotrophomonas sp. SY1]